MDLVRESGAVLALIALGGSGEAASQESAAREVLVRGIHLIQVLDFDGASQTVLLDFAIRLEWDDPSLAAGPAEGRVVDLAQVWDPGLVIENDVDLRRRFETARADSEGHVTAVLRYTGRISNPADFRDFPFDRHTVGIHFVFVCEPGSIRLVLASDRITRAEDLALAGWAAGPITARVADYEFPGRRLDGVRCEFDIARLTGFYAWKVIIPIAMIVFMAWVVFWIDRGQVASRVGTCVTSMLALIAYRFVVGGFVPPHSYLTRLDRFLVGSSLLIFLALFAAAAGCRLSGTGREARGALLDRVARVAFPVVFAAVVVRSFWL